MSDTPGDPALLIRSEDTAHSFRFPDSMDTHFLPGYAAEAFCRTGTAPEEYPLFCGAEDETGKKERVLLTPEAKERLMKALMVPEIREAGEGIKGENAAGAE